MQTTGDGLGARTSGARVANRAKLLITGLVVALALATAPTAWAVSFEVTKLVDETGSCNPGNCALREALAAANNDNAPIVDEITFADGLTGEIVLTAGVTITLPHIDEPLMITGPGADQLTINADNTGDNNGEAPIMEVSVIGPGGGGSGSDVTISGLTFLNGFSSAGRGGAISTLGADLTLREVEMTANVSSDDTTSASGGAIHAFPAASGGSLTIERSAIADNFAGSEDAVAAGGAIRTEVPTVIRNSTIHGNHARSIDSSAWGGAIAILASSLTVESSTITGNVAQNIVGESALGGGIYQHSTSPNPVLRNTIVADSILAGMGQEGVDLYGAFDGAFTLVEDTTAGFTLNNTIAGSNIVGDDPELEALDYYDGSPTRSRRPSGTSPVIDKGRSFCIPGGDQGSNERTRDVSAIANSTATGADGTEIGAVERQAGTPTTPALCVPPTGGGGAGAPISNQFSFGKLVLKKNKGISILSVNLPGPGDVAMSGPGIKPIGSGLSAAASRAVPGGRVRLRIKPGKRGKKAKRLRLRLKNKGKAKLRVRVTYVPAGGMPNTRARKVKLVRK